MINYVNFFTEFGVFGVFRVTDGTHTRRMCSGTTLWTMNRNLTGKFEYFDGATYGEMCWVAGPESFRSTGDNMAASSIIIQFDSSAIGKTVAHPRIKRKKPGKLRTKVLSRGHTDGPWQVRRHRTITVRTLATCPITTANDNVIDSPPRVRICPFGLENTERTSRPSSVTVLSVLTN